MLDADIRTMCTKQQLLDVHVAGMLDMDKAGWKLQDTGDSFCNAFVHL